MAVSTEYIKYQPEYNPEAIITYCSTSVQPGRTKNPEVKDMIMKAKKHLSATGWSFFYFYRTPERRELRYRSPSGRLYYSLRTACQSLEENPKTISKFEENPKTISKFEENPKTSSKFEENPKTSSKFEENPKELDEKPIKHHDMLSCDRPGKRIRIEDVESLYFQQQDNETSDFLLDENKDFKGLKVKDDKETMELGKRKKVKDFKPMKRIRKAEKGLSSRRRCILSLLIEKNIVLSGSRVSYCKKDGRVLAKGRIYDEGIQCDCCGEMFLLSKFEVHAGSTYRRPAANMFLDDGRSIVDCQNALQQENKMVTMKKSPKPSDMQDNVTCNNVTCNEPNDDFCSFCNDGGELVLCDSCTSSFHSSCIGLSRIPDSDHWFCPCCCCRICREGQFGNFTSEDALIKCAQCERQFHINCVTKLGFVTSNNVSDQWLCSESCERIHNSLTTVSGKTIRLTMDNLSWRLVKHNVDETNTYSTLNMALDVMHECFEPIKHRWSDNDLLEDMIFSKGSNRSNFKGFYTAVLEKDDEVITVAALRVYGCKVAEIPLVATRFRYRRLGMCRVLMDEIERKMKKLGVERLVLPAVAEMVSTWTGSFGFSVMNEVERLSLVEYKFVDFPGTLRCHKMLK